MNFNKVKKKLKQSAEEIETLRQRKIVKEQLYPILIEHSLSIEDAKMMCTATSVAIKQAFNNLMLRTLVEDLEMKTKIAEGNEKFKLILELFEKENITTAVSLLEGTVDAISSFQREESFKRKLDTLKTELL